MFERFFLTIVQMSVSTSYIIVFLLLFRFFVRKLPRKYYYFLWCVAFLMLAIPFGRIGQGVKRMVRNAKMPSVTEKLNTKEEKEAAISEIPMEANVSEEIMQDELSPTEKSRVLLSVFVLDVKVKEKWLIKFQMLYLFGAAIVVGYYGKEYGKKWKLCRCLVYSEEGNCIKGDVPSAFSAGIFHPKIYLPFGCSDEQYESMIQHESVHIKRGDLLVNFFFIVCVVLHWFNPFVWVAKRFAIKEMEMSCDEKAMDVLGKEKRKQYIATMADMATRRKSRAIFVGYETGVRRRIMNAINYKRESKTKRIISGFLCAGIVVGAVSLSIFLPKPVEGIAAEDRKAQEETLQENAGSLGSWTFEEEDVDPSVKNPLPDGMNLVSDHTDIWEPESKGGDYEEQTHIHRFMLTENGVEKVRVMETCVVYYYTNGKVHLYSRGLALYTASDFSNSYVTYGSIVNTDGSYSLTTGDRLTAIRGSEQHQYALGFTVTSANGPIFGMNQLN